MAKHTAGPWKTDLWNYPHRGQVKVIVTDKDAIGEIYGLYREDTDSRIEEDANARLIAAAPELLEALEMVLSLNIPTPATHDGLQAADALAKVRAAVAKATK